MNLVELVMEHPLGEDDDLLHGPQGSLTAGHVRAQVRELAAELKERGVVAGQPVAVVLPSGPEVVVAMTAIWAVEAVFVPVDPRTSTAEIRGALEATRPAAVIDADGVRKVDRTPASHPSGVAFVLWTSGTTGSPKPVLHTHDAYIELIDRVLAPLRGERTDPGRAPTPNLIPVSMALNAGIYNALFGLRAGAPLVIMERFTSREFAKLVRQFSIRSTVLPPAAMAMLVDDDGVGDLTPLRYVRSITAPLSPVVAARIRDRFDVFVLNGYGQAEIGEVIGWTAQDAKTHPDRLGAIGRPHPGVEIRIDEPDTNGTGELLVRPPNMAVGYADGTTLAERLTDDGFVHTGDLARIDADGFVWLEGRIGDVINRGGNKVFPAHVEEALQTVCGVMDAAVVGCPDERLGEVPVAFVVTETEVSDTELDEACRRHLAPYKVPVSYRRVDELPRSEVGKLLRRELVARL